MTGSLREGHGGVQSMQSPCSSHAESRGLTCDVRSTICWWPFKISANKGQQLPMQSATLTIMIDKTISTCPSADYHLSLANPREITARRVSCRDLMAEHFDGDSLCTSPAVGSELGVQFMARIEHHGVLAEFSRSSHVQALTDVSTRTLRDTARSSNL